MGNRRLDHRPICPLLKKSEARGDLRFDRRLARHVNSKSRPDPLNRRQTAEFACQKDSTI